jgi:hypothetical protein
MSVTPLDFQEFVGTTADEQRWQICSAILEGGGGGGGGDSDVAVGPDGVTRVPLNVNNDGELKVNVEASINADLTLIENKLDTIIGIETPQAADVAAIKTNLDNGIEVTNAGTFAVQNTSAIPAGTNVIGAVTSNNAATQVYNYTATGAVAGTPVIIPSIDCSQLREISLQIVSAGAGFSLTAQISNDGTNWVTCPAFINNGNISIAQYATLQIYNYTLSNARFFRVIQQTAQTSGTTTLVAYASQQATPKLYQNVSGTINIGNNAGVTPAPSAASGFITYHTLISTASTNATSVKTTNGTIGTLILTNTAATWAYFKLINKASTPTVGTDTAVINIGVAPNTTLDCSSSFAGLRMTTGIAYYVSGGPSLTDNTALLAANTFLVNMTYA